MKHVLKIIAMLSFLFFANYLFAQEKKWYAITKNDCWIMGTQAVAGSFDGFNQGIEHHHWGRGKPFWDANTSWKRKYKDYDKGDMRSAYPFSKNVLACTTDGFHLTRFVSRSANVATIAIAASDFKDYDRPMLMVLKKTGISIIVNRLFFALVYH